MRGGNSRSFRWWMKRIGPLLAILLGAAVLNSAYRGLTRVEKGEHLKTVDWLPAEATDVCFYRSHSFTAYEFDISEKGFLEWASRWEVAPITEPFKIPRYGFLFYKTPHLPDGPSTKPAEEQLRAYNEWRAKREATIVRGYCYAEVRSNGGGVRVAYDKNGGRAYYQSNPR